LLVIIMNKCAIIPAMAIDGYKIDYYFHRKQPNTTDTLKMGQSLVSDNLLMMNGDTALGYENITNIAERFRIPEIVELFSSNLGRRLINFS
jgi:hypothetical protein